MDVVCVGHDSSRHAAYVGFWIKAIRDDPMVLQRAASDAEKIVSFIKDLEQKRNKSIHLAEMHTTAIKTTLQSPGQVSEQASKVEKTLVRSEDRELTL